MGTYARYSGFAATGTAGTGTVTSVGLADGSTSAIYTITGSPVTTAGTLTFSLKTRSANTVFAGPTTGVAAQPAFRSLVAADLPTGNITDVGTDGIVITGGTGSIIGSGVTVAQHVADSTHNGYLSSTDWSTFNSKQAALTIGNLTDAGTDGITVTGGTGAVIGAGTSIAQRVADTTHNGYLSSTDWNTFNGKQAAGNYITALTGDGSASGPGSAALTLAATQSNITSVPNLATVGTITSGTWRGAAVGSQWGGTGQDTSASTGYPLVSSGTWSIVTAANSFIALFETVATALGDLVYGGASGTPTRLAGNITTTKKFLTQTGNGSVSAAPGWNTIAGSDLPNPSSSTLGGVQSAAAVSHQWINSISTSGVPALSQPASTDISDITTGNTATTFTWNGTGSPGTSPSVTLRWQNIGGWVTLFIPAVTATTGTSSSTFTSNTNLAASVRPATAAAFVSNNVLKNNGASDNQPGVIVINTSGSVQIFRSNSANTFSNAASAGIDSNTSITYWVGTGS